MKILVSKPDDKPGVAILHIEGDISVETHEQLLAEAEGVIKAGAAQLILDLRKVSAITSYGVRAINQIFRLLHDSSESGKLKALNQGLRDGTFVSSRLRLVGPTSHVRKVLTIAGLDMFLEVYGSLEEAIA